jgi:hypothetical protein
MTPGKSRLVGSGVAANSLGIKVQDESAAAATDQ